MPNWCANRWDIYCEEPEQYRTLLDQLTEEQGGERFVTFEKIAPMPDVLRRAYYDSAKGEIEICVGEELPFTFRAPTDEERALIALTGFRSWYEWSMAKWGTKWNTGHENNFVDTDERDLHLRFQTANNPPAAFYKAVRDRFPDVEISAFYDEPNTFCAGYLNWDG